MSGYVILLFSITNSCEYSLEEPYQCASNEYPQHTIILWRTEENYPRIITKYSSLTSPLAMHIETCKLYFFSFLTADSAKMGLLETKLAIIPGGGK